MAHWLRANFEAAVFYEFSLAGRGALIPVLGMIWILASLRCGYLCDGKLHKMHTNAPATHAVKCVRRHAIRASPCTFALASAGAAALSLACHALIERILLQTPNDKFPHRLASYRRLASRTYFKSQIYSLMGSVQPVTVVAPNCVRHSCVRREFYALTVSHITLLNAFACVSACKSQPDALSARLRTKIEDKTNFNKHISSIYYNWATQVPLPAAQTHRKHHARFTEKHFFLCVAAAAALH